MSTFTYDTIVIGGPEGTAYYKAGGTHPVYLAQPDAPLIPRQVQEVIVIDDATSSEEEEEEADEDEADPQPEKTLRACLIDYFDQGIPGQPQHLLGALVRAFRGRLITLAGLKAYLWSNTRAELDGAVDEDDPANDAADFIQLTTLIRHCEEHGVKPRFIEEYLLPLLDEETEETEDEATTSDEEFIVEAPVHGSKRLRRV